MVVWEEDISYKKFEETLEKRLKMYISLEEEKLKHENYLAYNYVISPKFSKSLTSYEVAAKTFFEVMNNLDYHYYIDHTIMLQGFYNYHNIYVPVRKFILKTTIENFQTELLSLSLGLMNKDEVYVNYIVRLPIVGDEKERTVKTFINKHARELKTKGSYYERQKEKVLSRVREYRIVNSESIKEQKKDYYKRKREEKKKYAKKYREENDEAVRTYQMRHRQFTTSLNKLYNKEETKNSVEVLGCNLKQFKKYIQQQFTEGMTWANFGKWELQFKQPISDYHTKEEQIKLNNYMNIKPVWKKKISA